MPSLETGSNAIDLSKLGLPKRQIAVNAKGIQLVVLVNGANGHDCMKCIDAQPTVRGLCGKQGIDACRQGSRLRKMPCASAQSRHRTQNYQIVPRQQQTQRQASLGSGEEPCEVCWNWQERIRFERRLDIHKALLMLSRCNHLLSLCRLAVLACLKTSSAKCGHRTVKPLRLHRRREPLSVGQAVFTDRDRT